MKTNLKIVLAITTVIIVGLFVYYQKSLEDSIVGCYVAHLAKDVYVLDITSQQGELFEGNLNINNYEKDSSTGTLDGTYKKGILLADYTFLSEGVVSVGPVVFKKTGDSFIRGYGPTNETGDRFSDTNPIKFDSSVVYYPSKSCATSTQPN